MTLVFWETLSAAVFDGSISDGLYNVLHLVHHKSYLKGLQDVQGQMYNSNVIIIRTVVSFQKQYQQCFMDLSVTAFTMSCR